MKAGGLTFLLSFIVVCSIQAQVSVDTLETVVIKGRYWEGYETTIFSSKLKTESVSDPGMNAGSAFREVNGNTFTSYGVSGLVIPRLRGTNPEHTAVLWNGINTNHAGLGQNNAFNLPLSAFDGLHLNLGGSSSVFGNGAIGGIIQADDRLDFTGDHGLTVESGAGSFGRFHSRIGYKKNSHRLSTSIRAYRNQADNDFSYINTTDFRRPEIRQRNAGFRQTGLSGHFGLKLGKNSQLRLHSWIHDGHTEIQPPMTNQLSDDWQKDHTHRHKLSWLQNTDLGLFEFSSFYTSDAISFIGDVSVIERVGARINWEKNISPIWSVSAGINNDYFTSDFNRYVERIAENRTAFYVLNSISFGSIHAGLNLRYSVIEGYRVPLTPSLLIKYHLIENRNSRLAISASYSENFRLPTLNERYWQPNANPDILPELSRQGEIGVEGSMNGLSFNLAVYQLQVDNVVRWIEIDSLWSEFYSRWFTNIFSPVNFISLESRGVNFSLGSKEVELGELRITQNFAFNHCHSITNKQEVGQRSLYVPENSFNSNTIIKLPFALRLGVNWQWFDQVPTLGRPLEAYSLLNSNISKHFELRNHTLGIFFRMNNMLNTTYQTFINRAMPGTNYLVSVRLKLKYNEN